MPTTLISVIIPTLNEAENIDELLNSLLKQPGLEIIVSDGGSVDTTLAICQQYPIKVVSGSAGRGRQLNRGAELGTGKVLLFLHVDSEMEPTVATQIREVIARGAKWGCATLAFDDASPFYKTLAYLSGLRARVLSSCYGDQGIWCERDFFWAQGGFPDYPLMEDLAFSHCLRRQHRATVVPGKIVTSSRRFIAGGPGQVWLKMQHLKLLYFLGVSPDKLAARYRRQ